MLSRRLLLQTVLATVPFLLVGGQPARADTASEAGRFIQDLADTAIATAAAGNISETERVDRFRRLFVSAFDLPEIARFVLGRYWRTATPAQQQRFLELFREITVLTWSRRFQDYGGETLDVINVAADGEQGMFVESRINRMAGGQAIPVTWRLRRREGRFQIVDIIVEGVSMAITHRSEYTSAVRSNGGDLDGLLTAMANKIDVLRG
ncbi:MAG: ABC transporter substrate-binding protein [Rhodospirillales bacterium]|nr:ABC transporter substrate-binding protein [Rhodospirillales bacterium]